MKKRNKTACKVLSKALSDIPEVIPGDEETECTVVYDRVDAKDPIAMKRADMYEELIHLYHTIEPNFAKNNKLVRRLEMALQLNSDNYLPPLAEMMEIRRLFYNLPLDQQRRALNGWEPRPTMMSWDEWAAQQDRGIMSNVLELVTFTDGRVTAIVDQLPVTLARGARVSILEGSQKSDVLHDLELIVDYLRENFEVAIGPDESRRAATGRL